MIKLIKNRQKFIDDIKDDCSKCVQNGNCLKSCGYCRAEVYADQKVDEIKKN